MSAPAVGAPVPTASARIDPLLAVAPLDHRVFGTFVEHMGRCVYSGIYEPGHPTADADGFRADVMELVRELGVTIVRYPGGNYVSGYRWEDTVGPVVDRPARLDLAWHTLETNEFGLDEFIRWTRKAGVEPMMALNFGTRGLESAIDVVEYANHPGGTALSDRRIANGAAEPYGIRMWCLGNEMDGPWQVGHRTPAEYARLAAETARALRMFDPKLELVACGSSGSAMPTFGTWEAAVLEEAYELVDYISLHTYYEEVDGDLASFLASGHDLDRFIQRVAATADHVGGKLQSTKRIQLSVDEWNVWHISKLDAQVPATEWRRAPRLSEEPYTVADAVVVGSLLITLLKHADRVTCACLAQLVNVIAPIRAEPGGAAWRQATFHPFSLTAANARGIVLGVPVEAPSVATPKYGDVPAIDAVATLDEADGRVAVFVVNRHPTEVMDLAVDVSRSGATTIDQVLQIADADVHAVNTESEPDRVVPHPVRDASLTAGRLALQLPPVSWTMATLRIG
jgi:alpha-N-arabinofuranosidase